MKHFINLKDIPAKDLRKIIDDAKKRKSSRKKFGKVIKKLGKKMGESWKILRKKFEYRHICVCK